MDSRKRIRLISPWTSYIETDIAIFSSEFNDHNADALLCEWAPTPELFTFPKRKAWYCCEPECQFSKLNNGAWPSLRKRLHESEFLYHSHPDTAYRVPHITHFGQLTVHDNKKRKEKALAIVSNHGGEPSQRHPDIAYRNQLITREEVDLYGRSGWKKYRERWYSLPRMPKNYCGEIPGDWPGEEKRRLMSQYKVCVCLENMTEPSYFTEKFVEAVSAGCIPVYRASAEIGSTILEGAIWFDPSDSRWPYEKAIAAALDADFDHCLHVNKEWIRSNPFLIRTNQQQVFHQIADILIRDC